MGGGEGVRPQHSPGAFVCHIATDEPTGQVGSGRPVDVEVKARRLRLVVEDESVVIGIQQEPLVRPQVLLQLDVVDPRRSVWGSVGGDAEPGPRVMADSNACPLDVRPIPGSTNFGSTTVAERTLIVARRS